MLKNDFLFVYGTLRRGERMALEKQTLSFGVTFTRLDQINGKMYHIGGFPGVKDVSENFNPNAPRVTGEVFKIRDQAITAILDAYEGYDFDHPENGHYDRKQVHTATGLLVWVYIYNPKVFSEQLIESGDWCKNRATAAMRRLEG